MFDTEKEKRRKTLDDLLLYYSKLFREDPNFADDFSDDRIVGGMIVKPHSLPYQVPFNPDIITA